MKLSEDLDIKLIIDTLKSIYDSEKNTFEAFKFNEIKYIILSHLQTSENISLRGMTKKNYQFYCKQNINHWKMQWKY